MKSQNWILHGIAFAGIAALTYLHLSKPQKIAYVDNMRILREYKGMQDARAKLDHKTKQVQGGIEKI